MFHVMKQNISYKKRKLADLMRQGLNTTPVIVLSGARQVGKSTLLLNEPPFNKWAYFSFDDPGVLDLARTNPEELLSSDKNLVVDEVQKAPEIFPYIKLLVDKDKTRHFVLSGSANLLLMKKVCESLAGRAIYFELLPFSLSEYKQKSSWLCDFISCDFSPPQDIGSQDKSEDLKFFLFRGLIPPVTSFTSCLEISLWWQGYIVTYLERDLRDLSQIANLSDFHRFMEVLALRCANILKQNEAARDAGISTSTASRYVNLLETGNIFYRLRPFFKNIPKRLIKAPKGFFMDTGLICALAGFKDANSIPDRFYAQLFENFVFQNLYSLSINLGGRLYYFRTLGGKEIEVDFLLEIEKRIIAIEVKYKSKISFSDANSLLKLGKILDNDVIGKIIIYAGDKIDKLPGNISLVPWWMI